MKRQLPDFISLQEASESLKISTDEMFRRIDSKHLAAYTLRDDYEPAYSPYGHLSDKACEHLRPIVSMSYVKSKTSIPDFWVCLIATGESAKETEEAFLDPDGNNVWLKSVDIGRLKITVKPTRTVNLPRTIVENTATQLYDKSGKFPKYTEVIKELNRLAKVDDDISAIILKAGRTGVYLTSTDEPLAIKTLQNWLTSCKETITGNPRDFS